MHGTPKRLALRDFSVWPSGPSFSSPAENEAYKKRVDQQRAEMWDHDKQDLSVPR
jgi:hydroxyacylglutathione hydrolase